MHTASEITTPLEFKNDVPFIKKGLPLDQIWFCGGRTTMTILRHGGIGQIKYLGRQAMPFSEFFKATTPQSSWEKLFRICVSIDGVFYYPELNQTRIYPFGYTSECTVGGVRFEHELQVLNDAVVQRIKILSNPKKKKFSLRLLFHGFNRVNSPNRTWTPWAMDEKLGGLHTSTHDAFTKEQLQEQLDSKTKDVRKHPLTTDIPEADTHIAIASNLPTSLQVAKGNFKYYLNTGEFKTEAAIFIAFAPDHDLLIERTAKLKKSYSAECAQQLKKHEKRLAGSPKITIKSQPAVQSCLTQIPSILDALEVKDIPGGYRAGMHGYWIWLDSLFETCGYAYSNSTDALGRILAYNMRVVDKDIGIPGLVTTHLYPFLCAEFNCQAQFIIGLYHHYCYTGDKGTLQKCYPLAKWVMEKCLELEIRDTGLLEGSGMPDHPASQTGKDVCSAANSWFYQALKCIRYLSEEMGKITKEKAHTEFAAHCDEVATRCCASFTRYFYDEEKGYFVDSLSSIDMSRRPHYPILTIQWQTPFAADLLGAHTDRVADFLVKNFSQEGGPMMFPTWDKAMPGDGNQLWAYYPSWSESFYRNTLKLAGRTRELEKWYDVVAWNWKQNTIPEGFTYDAVNEGFTPDNPGVKQAFGSLAWYSVFFRAIIGFEVDERGIVISPSTVDTSVVVKDVMVRGKKIDITVTGKGKKSQIVFNGKKLKGATAIVPFADLKKQNSLVIRKNH